MDFLLPLTIIGFIISIYQISEESKKRNFIFKIGFFDKAFLGFFAMILIFAIFATNFWSDQVSGNYVNISSTGSPFAYDIGTTNGYKITYSFLFSVIAFTVSVILILFTRGKLNSTELKQKKGFVANSLDKLGRQQYAEVAADLELFHDDLLKSYKPPKTKTHYIFNYIKYIVKILQNNINFQNIRSPKTTIKHMQKELISYKAYKVKQKEISESIGGILALILTKKKEKSSIQNFVHRLQFIRNRRESYCLLINNYYYELTGNSDFLEFISINNTDLMFMLLDNKLPYNKEDVWFVIGTQLISNEKSKLYKEIVNEESRQTKILDFLFADGNKYDQWLVWRPIGEYLIQHLREQSRKDIDEYNFYEEHYDEKRKNTPLYSGIKFFDIMVKQALRQNIDNHMWLIYFKYWSEHMLYNISYNDHEDAEFSNIYEYCLYLIIDCLQDWIRYVKEDKYTPENNSIIEYSIKTIVDVMEKVSSSQRLRDYFKNYLREMMIENYFELAAHHDQEKISQYVEKYKECIEHKVTMYSEVNQSFIDFLKYPVEHYHDKNVWDRGIYYDDFRDEFIKFLDSLSEENT